MSGPTLGATPAEPALPDELLPPGPARLAPALAARPVTLRLRDVPLRTVLDALSQSTGLKITHDPDVRLDQRATLFLENARLDEALELLLTAQQLTLRVLDERSLLIYPPTPAKQRLYAELLTRTLMLQHVDAAQVAGHLKTLLKTPASTVDARSNSLVIRDTPEGIALAERLITTLDRPPAELLVELELVEVSRQRLSTLGLAWPTSFSVATPTSATTLGALRALNGEAWTFSPLNATLNLRLQDLDGRVLARPSVRVRHKEKARLLIGDKVPMITAQVAQTAGTGGAVAATGGTPAGAATGDSSAVTAAGNSQLLLTGSVQYLDVGLKLEVEPQLHGEDEIGLQLQVELSQIAGTVSTATGEVYRIGTRQAQTSMRLRDGETQWLGGLITRNDRSSLSGLPGLSQLPGLWPLAGSRSGDDSDTELLLAVTPRVLRGAATAGADFTSGSEERRRERPLTGAAALGPDKPVEIAPGSRTGSAPSIGPVGRLPDPATVEAVRPDMPGLPAVMPRPDPGRALRGAAPREPAGEPAR